MNRLLPLLLLAATVSCAPLITLTAPTQVNTTVTYATGPQQPGTDNPVLAAIVGLAPSAPVTAPTRQPWRAEEVASNQVTIRSNVTAQGNLLGGSSFRNLPQEMTFTAISANGNTTLTAVYSSAYGATAQFLFDQLDKRFKRVALVK